MENWINVAPILVITAACFFMMLTDDWKKNMISNGIVFLSAFLILIQFWSFSFSIVKLITGLMSLAILGISINRNDSIQNIKSRSEKIFRTGALTLIYLIIIFISTRVANYLSIPLELIISALFILGFGIIQLGMSQRLYKVFLAILLMFFGFELIYSANEASLLVNGLLALVMMLVSLVGGYILVSEYESREE
ncbi:MAG: hypothetical protein FD147_1234 [Chloroflexi bacterium]|nr:MAG: hypothetical protein FD147_1234 [Chloroflexota bacterium]